MEVLSKKETFGHLIKWVIKLGDLLVINGFFIIAYKYLEFTNYEDISFISKHIGEVILLINLSYFITSSIINIQLTSNIIFFDKIVQKSISFISVYTVIFLAGLYLLDLINLSWVSFVSMYFILAILYTIWHMFFRFSLKMYRRKGHNYKTVIIIGGGINGTSVYHELSAIEYGYKVLGFFDDNPLSKDSMPNYKGTISKVEQFCTLNKVDEVYCTLPGAQESKIINLINFSENNMIRFYLVPDFYKYIRRKLVLRFLQFTPIIAIRKEPLQFLYNRVIKRVFDIVFSSAVLLTIFPIVYIIFGTIIKISSSGPIFFKQKRTGLQGEEFDCYKFRSMRVNDKSNIVATVQADPRITAIGKFMRKTSIDELPQFINVFLGNMSVVGPRPHMLEQTKLYVGLIDKFMVRHLVKPGITGWAQVSGFRGETKTIQQMESRFKADVWYLENWTFLLDIKIIAVTIVNLLRGDDKAY